MRDLHTDILIIGGSTGGVAAALAATSLGHRVILTESTDWIGGQLTSQLVPPDEHQWIEKQGCTCRYRSYRDGVRAYYRAHYPLTPAAYNDANLNPGGGAVSKLCHEPMVGLAVLHQLLAPARSAGRLTILHRHIPIAVDRDRDRIRSVTLRDIESNSDVTISAAYILDATDLGDLLPMAKVPYVSGAESRNETHEPHAVDGPAQLNNVQSFTWCFLAGYDPAGHHTIEKPAQYERWRDYVPNFAPPWPGKLLSWEYSHPRTLKPITRLLFAKDSKSGMSFFKYRQIVDHTHFVDQSVPQDVTAVNWPQNDYAEQNLIDQPEETIARALDESKQLSLSVMYWMQTEAPRHDGGTGYPGLYLCPHLTATADGLAKAPYIRESRRIKAMFTITEEQLGQSYKDSIGIGYYNIDLHPSTAGTNYIDVPTKQFQIPLGALIPQAEVNLLAACKNIGTTHITNGCYRLHPVEWNIGEAAGLLAAFCLRNSTQPHAVHGDEKQLASFQSLARAQGFELEWAK